MVLSAATEEMVYLSQIFLVLGLLLEGAEERLILLPEEPEDPEEEG